MYVSLTTVKVPGPFPNFTLVAVENPWPRIPTFVPTFPAFSTTSEANGFNPMHRDMNRGDQRLLWNAILNWQAILSAKPKADANSEPAPEPDE